MRRAPPPSKLLTLAPPEPRQRHFFYERRGESDRAAFELRVPGRKGKPDSVIAYGHMATCPQNNAPAHAAPDNAVVVDLGRALGCVTVRNRRPKRADGSRGAAIAPNVVGTPVARPSLDSERSAYLDVVRALKVADRGGQDARLALAPRVRIVRGAGGVIVTIPDRGAVMRWADIESLVWALARRLV